MMKGIKTFWICSNPECSSVPFVGSILITKRIDDKTSYRCRHCRRSYDAEILGTDICPRCGERMKYTKLTIRTCPKCGRLG